jgi:hypothetical protein
VRVLVPMRWFHLTHPFPLQHTLSYLHFLVSHTLRSDFPTIREARIAGYTQDACNTRHARRNSAAQVSSRGVRRVHAASLYRDVLKHFDQFLR